jgi:hypothetical protein
LAAVVAVGAAVAADSPRRPRPDVRDALPPAAASKPTTRVVAGQVREVTRGAIPEALWALEDAKWEVEKRLDTPAGRAARARLERANIRAWELNLQLARQGKWSAEEKAAYQEMVDAAMAFGKVRPSGPALLRALQGSKEVQGAWDALDAAKVKVFRAEREFIELKPSTLAELDLEKAGERWEGKRVLLLDCRLEAVDGKEFRDFIKPGEADPKEPRPFTAFSFTDEAGRAFRAGLVAKSGDAEWLQKTARGGMMDLQAYVVKLDGVVGGTPKYGLLVDRLVPHRSVDEGRSKVAPVGRGEVVRPIRFAPQAKGK